MQDNTESIRREMVEQINAEPGSRDALQAEHGQVWDTEQMQADFTVTGFLAPFVTVIRKSDGQLGTLKFQHSPRFYFDFEADR
jgi:hypothetical protein